MPDSLTLRRERKSIGRRLDLPCRCGDFFEVVSKRWMDVAGPELDNSRDPVFGLEYWLMTPVAGHLLWAANADHIDYLQEAVRERAARPASGLVTVLPGWMLQRNRRVHVLAGLRRLRAQAEATARGPGMSGDS